MPLSKKRHNNNMAAGNSSGNDTGSNGNSNKTLPPVNNGPDPSVFPKNPNFHQSLHGIAYSPEGSQLPNCGNTLGWLICIIGHLCFKWLDFCRGCHQGHTGISSCWHKSTLELITSTVVVTANQGVDHAVTGVNLQHHLVFSQRVRIYGADCNQSALVVSAASLISPFLFTFLSYFLSLKPSGRQK